ncbi:putative Trehalose synthase [Streptomyces afghaniensis 772]|uniref:maltose alpha-D-glucosyltransferase n=5 Tax=Streptomyces TaxID=1883 RepID=S4N3B9_9ACTN|nr:putative Trehalose synthase [Streptomyces afghaniensis 772]
MIFLAEAFTRPAMMHTLAQIGFQQSYTYFTWRNTKEELTEYLTELSGEAASYMRPNFFANTPDILHAYLQHGGRPAFEVRAVLAATLSPAWGIYSGYELCENTPLREGSEEYLDSEKYQLRHRDWETAEREGRTITPLLTRLNTIRREHPALHRLRNLRFHHTDNDALIAYSKRTGSDVVLVGRQPPTRTTPRTPTVSLDIAATRPGLARVGAGARRAHRRDLPLGQEQLRAPGAGAGSRARLPCPVAARRARERRGRNAMTVNEPVLDTFEDTPVRDRDPEWFKRAVFYEVLVRSFQDSDGDGIGGLKGLTAKLDYLQWLGVDCLWLPPFFKSPLRDGGYDVSDYTAVLPEFGDLADFVEFVDAAHQRGMRVIIDFVMNHTSDQHPWFQESRKDPDGPYGDYCVWADDDKGYPDARIIFVDTETSNWTFDPVRGQYFFHRFFSHQPDLNYENPRVQEEILAALKFWLDLGIDGFRLDAVPYLYAAEDTNCENLPATHAFLKRVRREIDAQYPDTVLLAEANQWPEDVVDYFGDYAAGGDECHMAFHFPVMPRIFMAVRRESRYPVSEILAKTPAIPSGCQWGMFLRNHDELTLEMVTDEERDYMWAEYAKDPRMRANIGIRRRLAPLLDNDRHTIELFTALLLALPGSPILYYGDEIGMGDNIWLGDRDAVRTPMQWTPDRNAGFSTCDPGRLYLPAIMDPVYGHQVTNVEASMSSPSSLLHWTRRMIEIRKQNPAFGLGSYTELSSSNPAVLAFLREYEDDLVLCVNNFARFAQPTELDLREFAGRHPVELFGGVRFPAIGELPYLLTLGATASTGSGSLESHPASAGDCEHAPTKGGVTMPKTASLRPSLTRLAEPMESLGGLLRDWLPRQRWFAGKDRPVTELGLLSMTELFPGCLHLLVHAGHAGHTGVPSPGGAPPAGDCYQLLLGVREHPSPRLGRALIGRVQDGPLAGLTVYDALHDPRSAQLLLDRLRHPGTAGPLRFDCDPDSRCPAVWCRGCWTRSSPTPLWCTATSTS